MPVTLFTLYLIACMVASNTTGQQCKPSEVSIPGKALNGHTFKTTVVSGPIQCQMVCENDPKCRSYNFHILTKNCEINDETKETKPHDFVTDDQRFYMKREDIDECKVFPFTCDVNADCQNTDSSYICTCKAGYTGDGKTCTEIDECLTGKHNCSHVAMCNNTIGSYNCTCKEGYVGDGRNCSDIDECSTEELNCSHVAVCKNTIGSYNCTCQEGYVGDGRSCSDIDECSTGKYNCSQVAVCNNTNGSYNCTCEKGYVGDGRNCSDIDECSTGEHNCSHVAVCNNTFGSYNCTCKEGYVGDGRKCSDIDECKVFPFTCDVNADCQNTDSSYICTCKAGYTGDGKTCTEIDECLTGKHNCSHVAMCNNTIGSYNCTCKEGYVGDGRNCSDIDECSTEEHNCSNVAVCKNTIGSYNCTCQEGYVGDGRSCSDIDECSTEKYNCSQVAVCNNTNGSYNCTCKKGYVGDGQNCSDIDECSTGEHNCSHVAVCNNIIGSYNCTCQEGYVGDGRSCSGYHFISSHREHKAGGGVGLYIQSHLEFKLRTDLQSPNNALYESILVEIIQPRDIDECSTGEHNCSHVAVCNNIIGSYNCTCQEGYVGDGRKCSGCPKDWEANGKHCYKLHANNSYRLDKLNDARQKCNEMSAYLPIIESEQENVFIANLMMMSTPRTSYIRLGMKREKGNLLWFDDVSAERGNNNRYNAWANGEPNPGKNCAHMELDSSDRPKWKGSHCDYHYPFFTAPFLLCQKSR
ncbi:fibrillin-1-like isoform X1 [Montipora foliosa]|uniref:fibrillin-1-like isoform X1 n=1 Tax=Montipora foliosa TaxID=591990 RepID=UPI0035F18B84